MAAFLTGVIRNPMEFTGSFCPKIGARMEMSFLERFFLKNKTEGYILVMRILLRYVYKLKHLDYNINSIRCPLAST